MQIDTHHIEVKKTGRYVTYGNLSSKTKYFWFALHGSRMLCEQMAYKFKGFDPDEHFIVAPEALIRYYEKGFGGPVLASWMTSRDRLKEISDFSFYLTKLYNSYMSQLTSDCVKTVLAFSQGGTTAYRWLHIQTIDLNYIIAYSCWIPEDIDLTASKTNLNGIKQIYTYGENDQFLTPDRINALQKIIRKNNLEIKINSYSGEHRVDKIQLTNLFEKYIKL